MVKHTQTVRLSVFDHSVGLVLKWLRCDLQKVTRSYFKFNYKKMKVIYFSYYENSDKMLPKPTID